MTEKRRDAFEILLQRMDLLEDVAADVRSLKATIGDHTGILGEHTRILNEHTRMLNDHGGSLKELTRYAAKHEEDLFTLRELAHSH